MPRIDLKQRVIPTSANIFCVYAGRHRRYYDIFHERGIVFLETPDIRLTDAIINDDKELRKRLRRSEAIQEQLDADFLPSPSAFRLSDYSGEPQQDDRSLNRLFGSFRMLFKTAKSGDLVISPGAGGGYRKILFGEFKDFHVGENVSLPSFNGMPVPVRRVEWIHEEQETKPLPSDLSKLLSQRPAVSRINRTNETELFYDLAYGSYITQTSSRLKIYSPKYRPDNFIEVNAINNALAIIIAAKNAIDKGQPPSAIRRLSDATLLSQYLEKRNIVYIRQHYASPGSLDFKSALREHGPLIAATLAIFLAGLATAFVNQNNQAAQLIVENSLQQAASDDSFCAEVAAQVKQLLESMGVDRCTEIQNKLEPAAKELGTEVPTVVRK